MGADLVPEDDEGVQRLLLAALLLPHLLGLSPADASAGRRLAASAKARRSLWRQQHQHVLNEMLTGTVIVLYNSASS